MDSSNSVWSNQTYPPLPHPLPQFTTLDHHISVLGLTLLSVIQLETSVIFYFLPVLLLSSKGFLIIKDKPELLNSISKALCNPIYISCVTSLYSLPVLRTSQTELLVVSWTHSHAAMPLHGFSFTSFCQECCLLLPVKVRSVLKIRFKMSESCLLE